MTVRISYILPAHNSATVLESQVVILRDRLGTDFPGSEVILVENGSTDETSRVADTLAERYTNERLEVIATRSDRGLGHAMREGVRRSSGETVVISGGIAFGFTDLDAALAMDPVPPFVIGSKAHSQSAADRGTVRGLTTHGFKVLRRLLLHTNVGDSQGSFVIDGELARALFPLTHEAGFVAQTEVVALAELAQIGIVEVPVSMAKDGGRSSVKPLSTSLSMLAALVRVRRRLPEMRRDVAALQQSSATFAGHKQFRGVLGQP